MKTSLLKAVLVIAGIAASLVSQVLLAQTAAPRAAGTSVVVIDVAEVFERHVRFKARMEDIKRDIETFEAELRNEQKQLNAVREELQNYKPGTDAYKRVEERMAAMAADAQVKMQLKRKEFLEQEAKVYFNAYQEVLAAVSQFADRNGISLVLRFNGKEMDPSQRESVLQGVNRAVVFQRNLNITDYIIERLNAGVPQESAGVRGPQIPARR
ncbi:MAG: OmpH family outer membrane protein [Pirellulaceae bacterium]|nr:OmpH family outer membrane protein [Pirellulaceae bacterium]